MKKTIQLICAMLFAPGLLSAQVALDREVTGSAGTVESTPSISLSWTLGEVAVATEESTSLILVEGFQQGDITVTGISENSFLGEFIVYPNPVNETLNFQIHSQESMQLSGTVYDISGKQVAQIPAFGVDSEYLGQVDCTNLPAGKWILRFSNSNGGETVKTFSFIKVR